jgi:hypothetical protein
LTNFVLTGNTSNWVLGASIGTVNTHSVLNSDSDLDITIFRNPVKEQLTIKGSTGYAIIFNALGQPVLETKITNEVQQVSIGHLPNGIYTIQLRQENGQTVTRQIMK